MFRWFTIAGFLFLVLSIAGCSSRAIMITLALDRSESNINSKNNRDVVTKICKSVVSKMKDIDVLRVKQFDSEPRPSRLDELLEKPIKKKRDQFIQNRCPKILPKKAIINVPRGTDITGIWMKYDKDTEDDASDKSFNIFILYVDSTEPVSQDKKGDYKLSEFKDSIQKFIKDRNFIILFVSSEVDREILGHKLETINDPEQRLKIINPQDYESTIDDIYRKARSQ